MSDCPLANIIAALFICSGFFIFTKPVTSNGANCTECVSMSLFAFLTSVFIWVSATNINLFKCDLPEKAAFVYEFIASMFIFELTLKYFWEPVECFIYTKLPPLFDQYVLDGSCMLGNLLCPGDTEIFTLLIFSVALTILWLSLSGFGIDADCFKPMFQQC